jgi:hypothetical protein
MSTDSGNGIDTPADPSAGDLPFVAASTSGFAKQPVADTYGEILDKSRADLDDR